MNDNAKAWVAALRSGEFKQTNSCLRDGRGYCCLGVACELAVRAGVIQSYNSMDGALPTEVEDWLGLRTMTGGYWPSGNLSRALTVDNDGGIHKGERERQKTFAEIADIIESEPTGLFREILA